MALRRHYFFESFTMIRALQLFSASLDFITNLLTPVRFLFPRELANNHIYEHKGLNHPLRCFFLQTTTACLSKLACMTLALV